MNNTDKRGKLQERPFSYKLTKSNKLMIFFKNKQIKTLNSKQTDTFIAKSKGRTDAEVQLILAKLTGNFNHGNECQKSFS